MRRIELKALLSVPLAALLIAGCGGGSGGSKTTAPQTTAPRSASGPTSPALKRAVTAIESAAKSGSCRAIKKVTHSAAQGSVLIASGCRLGKRELTGFKAAASRDYGPGAAVDSAGKHGDATAVLARDIDRSLKIVEVAPRSGGADVGTDPRDPAKERAAAEGSVAAYRQRDCKALAKYARSKQAAARLQRQSAGRCVGAGKLVTDLGKDRGAKPAPAGGTSRWAFYRLEANGHLYTVIVTTEPNRDPALLGIYPGR